MRLGDLLGYLVVGGLLASLTVALLRMRRRWVYVALAAAILAADLVIRVLSRYLFPPEAGTGFMHALNPARGGAEDLTWPNRALIFLLTSLALWLAFRPRRRSVLIGIGLALVTAGGWPNLLEPLMRGYTTDYLAVGPIVLNLADASLVLGLPVLLAGVLHSELKELRAPPQ